MRPVSKKISEQGADLSEQPLPLLLDKELDNIRDVRLPAELFYHSIGSVGFIKSDGCIHNHGPHPGCLKKLFLILYIIVSCPLP